MVELLGIPMTASREHRRLLRRLAHRRQGVGVAAPRAGRLEDRRRDRAPQLELPRPLPAAARWPSAGSTPSGSTPATSATTARCSWRTACSTSARPWRSCASAATRRWSSVGNSGGGGLTAFYQSQAESPTVTQTPAGDPPDLTKAALSPADGLLQMMAHPGRAIVYTEWLDPAIVDEHDPSRRDPDLDLFDPRNGPPFAPEFLQRYRAGQLARNRRITAWVREQLAELEKDPDGVQDLPVRRPRHHRRPAVPRHDDRPVRPAAGHDVGPGGAGEHDRRPASATTRACARG